jgi:hypothetical protein
VHELPAQPDTASDNPVDPKAAIELQAHLDDGLFGSEVGMIGIADHEIADLLRAETDAIEVVLRLYSAPFEFALEEVSRDRPPLDPNRGKRDYQQDQDAEREIHCDARPHGAANDHTLLCRSAEPLVWRPLVHSAF